MLWKERHVSRMGLMVRLLRLVIAAIGDGYIVTVAWIEPGRAPPRSIT